MKPKKTSEREYPGARPPRLPEAEIPAGRARGVPPEPELEDEDGEQPARAWATADAVDGEDELWPDSGR